MAEPLEEVKNRLRGRYLGRSGIHGMGISHADQAIRVYVRPGPDTDRAQALKELAEEAAPYAVKVVEEQPPSAK